MQAVTVGRVGQWQSNAPAAGADADAADDADGVAVVVAVEFFRK